MNAFRLDQKTALITGGGSGLGKAIARCFIAAGARVILVGRRERQLDQVVAELGSSAHAFPGDVTHLTELPRWIEDLESQVGAIDILVNNAGVHLKKDALETSDTEFASVLQTHLHASFALSREAARRMASRKSGHVLFIASMTGLFGVSKVAAYSAAKAALLGITRALAVEWAEHGIRVNAIAPGWIETDLSRPILDKDPDRKNKILTRTPLRRLGQPLDIGWAAVYLSSPAADFVTGTTLVVDGGALIGF